MEDLILTIIYCAIGYALGAFFTQSITLSFTTTVWSSAVTYLWIFCWPLMLIAHFFFFFLILFAAITFIIGLFQVFDR